MVCASTVNPTASANSTVTSSRPSAIRVTSPTSSRSLSRSAMGSGRQLSAAGPRSGSALVQLPLTQEQPSDRPIQDIRRDQSEGPERDQVEHRQQGLGSPLRGVRRSANRKYPRISEPETTPNRRKGSRTRV